MTSEKFKHYAWKLFLVNLQKILLNFSSKEIPKEKLENHCLIVDQLHMIRG